MRAIEVHSWGKQPVFNPSAKPPPQKPSDDQIQIEILAAGLHQLVRSQAAGKHYSTNPEKTPVPYIPGVDGVGRTPTGQLVYFSSIATAGAFADTIVLPSSTIIPIPHAPTDTTNQTKLATRIAALLNPAMSSWMALHTRITPSILQRPFSILIIGATSLSGQIAIKHARYLGAKTIIGLARNEPAMNAMDLDIRVKLNDDGTSDVADILKDRSTKPDIILDYLYGPAALHVLTSLISNPVTAHATATEYVNIGALTEPDIILPASLLRSKNLTLRGAGFGSWSVTEDVGRWFPPLLERLTDDEEFDLGLYKGIVQRRFEDAAEAWADTKGRTVFVN